MDVNDNALILDKRVALESIASRLPQVIGFGTCADYSHDRPFCDLSFVAHGSGSRLRLPGFEYMSKGATSIEP